MGVAECGALIHRLTDLIGARTDELALADTCDMGKPISDASGKDVRRAAQNFCFFADHARLAMAETLPMGTGHPAYTRSEPAGVVAAIAPWNFPLMLGPDSAGSALTFTGESGTARVITGAAAKNLTPVSLERRSRELRGAPGRQRGTRREVVEWC